MSTVTPINGFSVPELGDGASIVTAVAVPLGQIDQYVVPRYASVTARNAAITVPVAGMLAYVSGTDELYKYNGTAWVGASPRTKYCTADQTVADNDTVLTDSLYLTFSVEANSVYKVYGSLRWLNTTFANDVRFGMTSPAGCSGSWTITHVATDDTFSANPAVSWAGSHTYGGSSSSSQRAPITGLLVVGSTAGTVTLQFCEAVNSVGASNVKLCFDSELSFLKIG